MNQEQIDWDKRKGLRDQLRSQAQRSDPNLRAYCPRCKKLFTGTQQELLSAMTKHQEEQHE